VTQVVSQKRLHFWNPRFLLAYSLYKFYWATTTIKGRILSSRPMLKPSSGEKIVLSKWVRKMVVLEENRGRNVRFWVRDPKKTLPCAEPRRLTYFLCQNRCARLGCCLSQEPKSRVTVPRGPKSHMSKTETPWTNLDKILLGGRYPRRSYLHKLW